MLKIITVLISLNILIFAADFEKRSELFNKIQNNINSENPDHQLDYDLHMKYFSTFDSGKGSGMKQYLRARYIMEDRMSAGEVDYLQGFKDYENLNLTKTKVNLQSAGEWQPVGPFDSAPTPSGGRSTRGTGRVNSIVADPNSPNIMWAGAAGGGIWKTTNKGQTWIENPITEFASIGINDIAISPSNTSVVYAASGDVNGRGTASGYNFYSIGLFKTTNGGNSWSVVSPFSNNNTSAGNAISQVAVNPNDQNDVFVATGSGFYRSTNGGSSWSQIDNGNYLVCRFNKGNDNLIHLTKRVGSQTCQIRTYNIQSQSFVTQDFYTLPDSYRIELAPSKDRPNIVYGLVANFQYFLAIVKSDDFGSSWEVVNSINDNLVNYMGFQNGTGGDLQQGQAFYDLTIDVNPDDHNDVWIGGINLWRSTDGGESFSRRTNWWQVANNFVHADQHFVTFNSVGDVISGNDGGIHISTNDGQIWTDINTDLSITQFYRFSNSPTDENKILGGTQDNGTWFYDDGWMTVQGGDGFDCGFHPENENLVFATVLSSTQLGASTMISLSSNGPTNLQNAILSANLGERSRWVAPVEWHPTEQILYYGFNNIYATNLQTGQTSRLTDIQAGSNTTYHQIAISKVNTNHIWASIARTLQYSSNGGQSWETVFNAPGNISDIEPSNADADKVFVSISGFSNGNKVFAVDGSNSTNISANLPNLPANSLAEIPDSQDLYLGMDAGIYRLIDGDSSWEIYNENLPNTIVTDLEYQVSSKKLRAATYGRGVWEAELIECEVEAAIISSSIEGEDITICKGESVELTIENSVKNYQWSNGERTRTITANESGEYYVTTTGANCQRTSNVINITVEEAPEINLAVLGKEVVDGVVTACEGEAVGIRAAGLFSDVTWSVEGGSGIQVNVTEDATVYMQGKTSNGNCFGYSDTIQVVFVPNIEKPEITKDERTLVASEGASSYIWTKDGAVIEGATAETYLPESDGLFTVIAVSEDGCENESDEFEYNYFAMNVDLAKQYELVVSPNPNNGDFNIRMNKIPTSSVLIEVTNLSGQSVFAEEVITSGGNLIKEISLNNLPSNTYFVNIIIDENTVTKKFIIK